MQSNGNWQTPPAGSVLVMAGTRKGTFLFCSDPARRTWHRTQAHLGWSTHAVNYDPRERVISRYLEAQGLYNVFLDFYHRLARELQRQGVTSKVHAVNVDAVLTCVCLGIAWPLLVEKKITLERAVDLPFLTFALGRVAGGAAEYLDHRESGTDMDMRVPVSECRELTRPRD